MTIERADHAREKGMALVYVGIFLVPLLLCTGLAVDLGRGYLVRATLAKAVDAAALAAARNITGDSSQAKARSVGENIFNVNFPPGFLGVSPSRPEIDIGLGPDGSHVVSVRSDATLPTTFMRVARFDSLTVRAGAEAKRRLVDMSFVIDRSGSLSGEFAQVKQAAKQFVSYFDQTSDRIALITFSSGTTLTDQMWTARGFDQGSINGHIDSAGAQGFTATAEALYEAWDQLRSVPSSSRSGLRIVVLFTDGSPNSFPGKFSVSTSGSRDTCSSALYPQQFPGTLSTYDYPAISGNVSTTSSPDDVGLYDTYATGLTCVSPTNNPCGQYDTGFTSNLLKQNKCIPNLPSQSYHPRHVSSGIPTGFPLYDPSLRHQRTLLGGLSANGYENHWQNANHAARNLAESIANAIRSETDGSPKIRIYTLGLGDLLNQPMGKAPSETGSSILQRIANDPASSDYDPSQPDGRYFFAGDAANLSAAFQAVRDQIVRLTQ